MRSAEIRDALLTLAKMAEMEIAVAEFYAACGQQWADESQVWSRLSSMEIQHAMNIRKVADALRDKPEEFRMVRFVNPQSLEVVIARLKNYADKVRKGMLSKKEAILIAQDTESSVMEVLLTGIFEAKTEEYRRLVRIITEETAEHKSYFDRQVKGIRKPAAPDAAEDAGGAGGGGKA